MSFVIGLLIGLAVGVVSYLLFVATSQEIPNISTPETTSDIETREAEKFGALLQIQDAIHSLSVGVVIVDARGVVTFRNKLAESVTGVVHSDVLVEEVVEQHLSAALNGETKRQVLDLFGPPRKVFSVSATPLLLGGAVAMIEDITERYLVDAVRTDFVANISHELKTPVGALAVLAEALSQEDDLDIIHRLSEKMVDEAIRVGRTIDDLLELSRIEFGGEAVKDEVDAEAIISESISRVSPLASTHAIKVAMVDFPGELKVVGDRRQLVSAIGNLVENAVKYSDVGSAVEVTARGDGDWVEFTVKDFGLGIPSRDLDRVFERFYRVDRARSRDTGGTGLGLAIVRHVANNHGGEVSVTSIEGEGSTFALKIPKFIVQNQSVMKESA
jgi:two-component system sensor histidine kinase SenX3